MKIKTKMWMSNIMMVLIPIAAALLLGYFGLINLDSKYIYSLEKMFEDENAVVSAQSMIYSYQEELWNTNWEKLEEEEVGHQNEEDKSNIKWSELGGTENELAQTKEMYNLGIEMEQMGYHFSVFMDGDCQYSNLTKEDSDILERVAGESITHTHSLVIGEGNYSVIKNTFEKNGTICVMIAVSNGVSGKTTNGISQLKQYLSYFICIFCVSLVLIIFLANLILAGLITRSIISPLQKLGDGTKRICEGDLDTEMNYQRNDEIGEVCNAFENMRGYLKESALERIAYEAYRRELISGISHDLRTPLTSIKGYLEGLTMGIAKDAAMRERYYNAIKTRTNDLENLVDDLSVYNRLEEHSKNYIRQEMDFKRFLEKYLEERKIEHEKEKINVKLISQETTYKIIADPEEMVRVFDNLFSNTKKYRDTESSIVFITFNKSQKFVICSYEDDAKGVPEDSLERIFESFYRVDAARNHAEEGSGLGLAIVKDIIYGQNGTIKAENGTYGLKIEINLPELEEQNEDIDH